MLMSYDLRERMTVKIMYRRQLANTNHFMFAAALAVLMLLLSSVVKGQQTLEAQADRAEVASSTSMKETKEPASAQTPAIPVPNEFMGVRLGMSAEDVREKLGNLKDKGDIQDVFVFSDSKSAQVYYDKQGDVMALSIDFIGYDSEAPQPEAVLGEAHSGQARWFYVCVETLPRGRLLGCL